MPNNSRVVQRPISEQIEELKSKIALLEGDRKAYVESSQYAIKNNKAAIISLRKETKELRQRLKDRLSQDAHVIGKALHDRPVERAALSKKSGQQAIVIFDHKVCDSMKLLNVKRHITARKQKKLAELQTRYDQMVKDSSDMVNTDKGESVDAQTTRYLENSYDKIMMKTEEAKQVQRVYMDIKNRFEVEAQEYPRKLEALESEIQQTEAQLKDLKTMYNDAQLSKEAAVNDLRQLEETVYAERKKREIELQKMKKEAEEKKMQHERIEKRLTQMQHDGLSSQERSTLTYENHHQKITTYEEAFKVIKDCTGISDTMEVVLRFEHQGDTTHHLEQLKKDNEKQIIRLREEEKKLQQEFEEMKYSGEAKLSSGQAVLEEFEDHLAKEEARRDNADKHLQEASRILVQAKAGVEHLASKLHHLKVSRGHVLPTHIPPTSDEYVLNQLSTVEEKLLKLLEELDGKDLSETQKQMEEEEFHASIEGKLPMYNTRVKLPQPQRDLVYDDDEDSGEDDVDVPNRSTIKKQSQFIVDSKTKRRVPKKKKKMK